MSVFALVDCNNFYASCETVFRPDLKGKPVVVLSNNDGCVVARNPESKALGIKMGVPVHQIKDQIADYGVQLFSSNYALYGDMSHRVMRILAAEAPSLEVYSIDEAFLDLTGVDSCVDLTEFGLHIRQIVLQQTGITVCVGIAPTKTLAKLANHGAKKYPATRGVVDLTSPERQRKLMALVDIGDVWGVGRKLATKLNGFGIHTALELAQADPVFIRQQFSVVLERTVRELNGESCLALDDAPTTKQQIVCSRSFGKRITCCSDMREAIYSYTAKAAEKLRKESQCCQLITVFIRTSPFDTGEPYYSNSASTRLVTPTSDSRVLLSAAKRLLQAIWKDNYRYAKAGVMLADFIPVEAQQSDLFASGDSATNNKLMQLIDSLNGPGKRQVFLAGEGTGKSWNMNRQHLSPAYTTRWSDLLRVR